MGSTDSSPRSFPSDVRASCLSADRRRLVALLQRVSFGNIERLVIRGGEPVFDPPPKVAREVKFAAGGGPREEPDCADFALKAQVVELFAHCERLRDGVIDLLVVKHGLPFQMIVEEAA
jgi:hypothetical protein